MNLPAGHSLHLIAIVFPKRFRGGDMQIKCYDEGHWVIIVSIFLPAFLAYVIGIPLYFFVGLRRNRDTLASNVHTKFRYSTLL